MELWLLLLLNALVAAFTAHWTKLAMVSPVDTLSFACASWGFLFNYLLFFRLGIMVLNELTVGMFCFGQPIATIHGILLFAGQVGGSTCGSRGWWQPLFGIHA